MMRTCNEQMAEASTYVPQTVQDNPYDFTLLNLFEVQLCEPFACIDVILVSDLALRLTQVREEILRTSLLMRTTNILLLISVFIPCFRASLRSALSVTSLLAAPTADAMFFPCVSACRSTSGSPPHAAPTSHHFPLLPAERRSASDTRSGSCASTDAR